LTSENYFNENLMSKREEKVNLENEYDNKTKELELLKTMICNKKESMENYINNDQDIDRSKCELPYKD